MVKPVVAAFFALLCTGTAAADVTAPAPSGPPPYTCTAAAHRAFDFWVGSWDVVATGTSHGVGRSLVERKDGGCVITEQWTSNTGLTGRSLNMFDATTGQWVQVWMDSSGEITRYKGGPTPNGMQLTAEDETSPSRPVRQSLRMTFTRNPDGTVRQLGETSPDRGVSWTTSYDLTYRPH